MVKSTNSKEKTKISVGARVQLKKDQSTDGKVLGSTGKAKWNVEWTEGDQRGQTTEQSTKSIRLWRVNIAEIQAADTSSDSGDDEAEPINHPELKRKFEAHAKSLENKQVKVRCPKMGEVTWTYAPRGSATLDYFPSVSGPTGVKASNQMDVLKNFKFLGERGDSLRSWLQLYPGDIGADVAAISSAMKVKDDSAADLTIGEYVVFHGLFVGASVCVQRGHELWDAPRKPRRFRKHPGFSEYMTRNRFDAIKSCLLAACGDSSAALTDKWWGIRPLFDRFNENRLRTVVKSELQVPDEVMSAFQPRTTPAADLDHLSYVERKPKKLGTEVKCVADGGSGVMRFLGIQEGAGAMATKRHRAKHAPATAQAMRLVEGTRGARFS